MNVHLFCGVKGNKTGDEGKGDEGQTSEGDGELLLIGHLVHVGGEVLVGLVVAGELLGLLALSEHVKGSGWGGHGGSLGEGGGGGKGTDGGHREDGDEEGGNEGGLAHHIVLLIMLYRAYLAEWEPEPVNDIIVPADWMPLRVTDSTENSF